MGTTITVGIADLKVGKGDDVLVTYALGSCVGICLYDAEKKIAGLAHIMLPLSKDAAVTSKATPENRRRYADTGITELIQEMSFAGASTKNLTAKIAGGAQMFSAVPLGKVAANAVSRRKGYLQLSSQEQSRKGYAHFPTKSGLTDGAKQCNVQKIKVSSCKTAANALFYNHSLPL